MTNTQTTVGAGRKGAGIVWPQAGTRFTIKEVFESNNQQISKMTIQVHINKMVKNGQATLVDTRSVGVGRPSNVYEIV